MSSMASETQETWPNGQGKRFLTHFEIALKLELNSKDYSRQTEYMFASFGHLVQVRHPVFLHVVYARRQGSALARHDWHWRESSEQS